MGRQIVYYHGAKKPAHYHPRGSSSASETFSKMLTTMSSERSQRKIAKHILHGALSGDLGFIRLYLSLLPKDAAAKQYRIQDAKRVAEEREKRKIQAVQKNLRHHLPLEPQAA